MAGAPLSPALPPPAPLPHPPDFVVSHPSHQPGPDLMGRLAGLLLDQRRIKPQESGAFFAVQARAGQHMHAVGGVAPHCTALRRLRRLACKHMPLHATSRHTRCTQEKRLHAKDVRARLRAEIQRHEEGELIKGGLESDRWARQAGCWPRAAAAAAAAAVGACRAAFKNQGTPAMHPPGPLLPPGWTTFFVRS